MRPSALLSPDESGLVHLGEASAYPEAGIVSRTVLAAGSLRVVHFAFASGQELSEHTSTARALVHVLEGRADFTVGGRTHDLHPGDLLHLPPGAPHAVIAREPFSMLLVLHHAVRETDSASD